MTDNDIFYFAVKPGCEPVHLPSLSAHSTLPWVARGYELFEFEGDLGTSNTGKQIMYLTDRSRRFVKMANVIGLKRLNYLQHHIKYCVAKCVSKDGVSLDSDKVCVL